MPAYSLKQIVCLGALLLGVAGKFWLIGQCEIVDDYHDPSEYVLQILYPDNGGLGYGPGTGLFCRPFFEAGIPYRLGIETACILACLLTVRALFDWPGRAYLPTFLFLFALFDPNLAEQCSQMYSDPIWMVETMTGLALIVLAAERPGPPRWPYLFPAALALGMTTITRSVFIPLVAGLALFGLLALAVILARRPQRENRGRLGVFLLTMWTIFLGVGVIYFGTCVYHEKKFGFYGISVVDSNEYKTFYLCLQSVGEPTGVAYCPVDRARRNLIAAAGPNARWLMERLDQDREDNQAGFDQYGEYDIPSGQFDWATYHNVLPSCQGNLRGAFAFFKTVEDEIAAANRRGAVKVRPVLPLPDTRLGVVMSVYPEALGRTLAAALYEPVDSPILSSQDPSMYRYETFTRALHRRTVTDSPVRNRLWQGLGVLYSGLYGRIAFYLFSGLVAAFALALMGKGQLLPECPPKFLMEQLFVVMFFTILGWYSVFVASGLPPLSRYLIYNHVMMPMLAAYYLSRLVRLLKNSPPW